MHLALSTHRVAQGLRLPISGEPDGDTVESRSVSRVALVADDYVGLVPRLLVGVGDMVRRGQPVFEDKATAGVRHTAPAEGQVVAIHRGQRRALQSVVIELSTAERASQGDQVTLSAFTGRPPLTLTGDAVRELLLQSGLWTALRARPFSRVANPAQTPRSIFVTAIDSEPLAPNVARLIAPRLADFERGLAALTQLTAGPVVVCSGPRWPHPLANITRVVHHCFVGPHPAGTVGVHMHIVDPAGRGRLVWHIGYQDVVAIGELFETGRIDSRRTIALAGPSVRRPRIVHTRIGAAIDELTRGALADGAFRLISGSVLSGRGATSPEISFLGRYHRQVSALPEGYGREFVGWATPGIEKFSVLRAFISSWLPPRPLAMTTSTHGSPRALVPIGVYERVWPFDIEPTCLLKALLTRDVERAEQLGVLELDEEDLSLCTFVCPGKHEYGRYLREVLTTLEEEG